MTKKPGIDRFGRIVEIGDKVRLLAIRSSILDRLAGNERTDVSSMLGQILEVFDVYDDGLVWVNLWWNKGNGKTESHSIAVDTEAIELVSKANETQT